MKYLASILLFYAQLTFAQTPRLYFKHLNEDQGLSQSFVNCLLKDTQGFAWAGTQDGLNKFDGYNFKSYYNNKEDSLSLTNSYILDLLLDSQGKIWIGTRGGGLGLFQPEFEHFTSYLPTSEAGMNPQHLNIRTIIELDSNRLLLGTDSGLLIFDATTERFEQPSKLSSGVVFDASVYSFIKLAKDQYLIGSLETILFYDDSKSELSKIELEKKIEGGIHSFALSNGKHIWVGSGKGLLQYKWKGSKHQLQLLRHFQAEDQMSNPISSNYIATLHLDKHQQLWIGTNDGLNYFNLNQAQEGFQIYKHEKGNEESISDNIIYDLLEVEEGIMWAATQGGISQFQSKPSAFNKINLNQFSDLICASTIHGMVETASSQLLACTEKGLIIFEPKTRAYEIKRCLAQNEFPQMEDEFLISISKGIEDHFWIAQRRGGFAKLSRTLKGFEWKAYKLPAGAYSNIGTNDILEDSEGKLWIGSSGLGLWKLDLNTGKYQSFQKSTDNPNSISGNYIFKIIERSDDQLWIATADGGFCLFNKRSEQFTCFSNDPDAPTSLSSNMVLSVFEDSQKQIWVGTADGLNLLQRDSSFQRFHQKDGLPNPIIYGMLEDENGAIWLSTNKGIAKVKYLEGQFQTNNYFQSDGLLDNEFNQHAFLKLANGDLVFGSKNGLSFFHPNDIKPYDIPPVLNLKTLKLFNEAVPIGRDNKEIFTLEKALNFTKKISLPYHRNFLAFEFTGINFNQASLNQYAYQLEGLDQDWVYCDNRKFANYPGLKPGRYTFHLKAANHDGIWTEPSPGLKVLISPPPWKTWWAYLSYFLGIGLLLFSLFQYRLQNIRKIEAAKANERLQFRKRSARDFHDEAGNQITKISLIAGIAKQRSESIPELKTLLSQLENNVQALRTGMRDFIWVLDPEQDTLFDTLSRLKDFANEIFEYSPIHFTTKGIEEGLKNVPLNGNQRRHLLLIFKEAINNCLKYSTATNAQFTVEDHKSELILKFSDDGIGFNPENENSSYGLGNIKERAKKIGAKHQIRSNSNGTSVYLHLLKDHPNG